MGGQESAIVAYDFSRIKRKAIDRWSLWRDGFGSWQHSCERVLHTHAGTGILNVV